MNLLLDTHIAIWTIEDNPRLSKKARRIIANPSSSVFVSVVSVWEIAIKHALQRGARSMPLSGQRAAESFAATGLQLVPVSLEHTLAVEMLPHHHDDPFDRLIVATALTEPYRLVTHDAQLSAYGGAISVV